MALFLTLAFVIIGLVLMRIRQENIMTGKTKRHWSDF